MGLARLGSTLLVCLLAACGGRSSSNGADLAGHADGVADGAADGLGELSGPPRCTAEHPAKVDLLIVIEPGVGMCEEQVALARALPPAAERLAAAGAVDLRLAVTTVDQLTAADRGRFNRRYVTQHPGRCGPEVPFPAADALSCECAACEGFARAEAWQRCADDPDCTPSDADAPLYAGCRAQGYCATDLEAARWRLLAAPRDLYNANGSVNARCRYRCGDVGALGPAADARCAAVFGADTLSCVIDFADVTDCREASVTEGCPPEPPAVLPARDGAFTVAEHARCLVQVGSGPMAADLEGGLLAPWLALAQDGPWPLQVCGPAEPPLATGGLTVAEQRDRCERRFLREGALLVVLVVTDEDDCSLREGARVVLEDYENCALLGDPELPAEREAFLPGPGQSRSDERPLAPTRALAERLRGLVPDPALVVFAAIVGDAAVPADATAAEVHAARLAYLASSRESALTYACAGPYGEAELGQRYIDVVEAFGERGFLRSLCAPGGLDASLADLVDHLVPLLGCEQGARQPAPPRVRGARPGTRRAARRVDNPPRSGERLADRTQRWRRKGRDDAVEDHAGRAERADQP